MTPSPRSRERRLVRRLGIGAAAMALTLPLLGPALAAPEEASFTTETIAEGGDGDFAVYRIPAIVQLENGDILASYDGRPTLADAPEPNSILQRRSTDGGRTWGGTTVIDQGEEGEEKIGYSDPSYVYDRETGALFNFHVFSKDTGFWNSDYGNDDEDRDVMSAAVAASHDDGRTWQTSLITDVVKPEDVRATFASSGAGIQVTRGEHAGRLVQQYAGEWRDGSVRAYSVYSDDHGETWQMGEPVGTDMDENKVVELSDGRLMMNSRMHAGGTARYVAYSEDGGESWSEPEVDHSLTDPRNNASIIAMNPGAAEGSPEARELLFSNSDDPEARVNGTISYSCDDGQTWPVSKSYAPGDHAYSQLAALQDGSFGVVYEADGTQNITYGSFTREWLDPFCLDIAPAQAELPAGGTADLEVTVRNDDTRTLDAANADIELPKGWSAQPAELPELAPGQSATFTLPVTASDDAREGEVHGEILLHSGERTLRGDASLHVTEGADAVLGAEITGEAAEERDLAAEPYTAGEEVPYAFTVTSTANVPQTVTPVSGDFTPFAPPGAGNCRYRDLAAGGSYTCDTPRHEVSEEDLARGYFLADTEWELSAEGAETTTVALEDVEVDVLDRSPGITASASAEFVDEDGDGYASSGDHVRVDVTAVNSGNVRLDALGGDISADELAAGEEATGTVTVPLSDEALETGVMEIPEVTVTASNGSRDVNDAVTPDPVQLDLAPAAPAPDEDSPGADEERPGPDGDDPAPAPGSDASDGSDVSDGSDGEAADSTGQGSGAGSAGGGPTGAGEQGSLARTGSNALPLALAGAGALLAGIGATLLGRRARVSG